MYIVVNEFFMLFKGESKCLYNEYFLSHVMDGNGGPD